ncbi:MAG: class I SAM-dependent methyltransferase, partial [Maioricimonas sp. JB049]
RRFYANEYRRSYKGVFHPKTKHVYRSGRRALKRFELARCWLTEGTRVLDLGSGGGEFVYLLRQRGIEARGVEPDEGYGGYSISEYEIPVHIGPFQSANIPEGEFDLITAHHVVEHLNNPLRAFRKALTCLKTGGRFVVEVPNVESQLHAARHKWHYAHIFNYNPCTLELLGQKAGFHVEQTTLVPNTRHVLTVFIKQDHSPRFAVDPENCDRIKESLPSIEDRDYYLSGHGLWRLSCSLRRMLREKLSVSESESGRNVLDRMYSA